MSDSFEFGSTESDLTDHRTNSNSISINSSFNSNSNSNSNSNTNRLTVPTASTPPSAKYGKRQQSSTSNLNSNNSSRNLSQSPSPSRSPAKSPSRSPPSSNLTSRAQSPASAQTQLQLQLQSRSQSTPIKRSKSTIGSGSGTGSGLGSRTGSGSASRAQSPKSTSKSTIKQPQQQQQQPSQSSYQSPTKVFPLKRAHSEMQSPAKNNNNSNNINSATAVYRSNPTVNSGSGSGYGSAIIRSKSTITPIINSNISTTPAPIRTVSDADHFVGTNREQLDEMKYLLDGCGSNSNSHSIRVREVSAIKLLNTIHSNPTELLFLMRSARGFESLGIAFSNSNNNPVLSAVFTSICYIASRDKANAPAFTTTAITELLNIALQSLNQKSLSNEGNNNISSNNNTTANNESTDNGIGSNNNSVRSKRKSTQQQSTTSATELFELLSDDESILETELQINPTLLSLLSLCRLSDHNEFKSILNGLTGSIQRLINTIQQDFNLIRTIHINHPTANSANSVLIRSIERRISSLLVLLENLTHSNQQNQNQLIKLNIQSNNSITSNNQPQRTPSLSRNSSQQQQPQSQSFNLTQSQSQSQSQTQPISTSQSFDFDAESTDPDIGELIDPFADEPQTQPLSQSQSQSQPIPINTVNQSQASTVDLSPEFDSNTAADSESESFISLLFNMIHYYQYRLSIKLTSNPSVSVSIENLNILLSVFRLLVNLTNNNKQAGQTINQYYTINNSITSVAASVSKKSQSNSTNTNNTISNQLAAQLILDLISQCWNYIVSHRTVNNHNPIIDDSVRDLLDLLTVSLGVLINAAEEHSLTRELLLKDCTVNIKQSILTGAQLITNIFIDAYSVLMQMAEVQAAREQQQQQQQQQQQSNTELKTPTMDISPEPATSPLTNNIANIHLSPAAAAIEAREEALAVCHRIICSYTAVLVSLLTTHSTHGESIIINTFNESSNYNLTNVIRVLKEFLLLQSDATMLTESALESIIELIEKLKIIINK